MPDAMRPSREGILSNIRFAIQRLRGVVGRCSHRQADEASHPIARSVEPGEDWMWCYVDRVLVEDTR